MDQMERVIHLDLCVSRSVPFCLIVLICNHPDRNKPSTIKDLDNCDLFGGQGAIQRAFGLKLKSEFREIMATIVFNFIFSICRYWITIPDLDQLVITEKLRWGC